MRETRENDEVEGGRTPGDAGARNGARERILARVRQALSGRPDAARPHPGALDPTIQAPLDGSSPVEAFARRLEANGGEVVRLASEEEAVRWLAVFAAAFEGVAVGSGVPSVLRPALPKRSPEEADLGISMAVGAAAQTGSLVLSSREGRQIQILPPAHLVWIRKRDVAATLGEALARCREDPPALLALHSGPSKSADIGQILVTGVHGPGRLVAAVVE